MKFNKAALNYSKVEGKLNKQELFFLGILTGASSMLESMAEKLVPEADKEELEQIIESIFDEDAKEELCDTVVDVFELDDCKYGKIIKKL